MIFIPPPVETAHIIVPDGPEHAKRSSDLLDYHARLSPATRDARYAEAIALVVKHLPLIRKHFGGHH